MSHRVGLEVGLPGSDVDYQKMTYDAQAFKSLPMGFVLRGYGKLGYGNDLPFYKNFYAGGYGSVRGYDNSSLGPKYPSVIFQATGKNDPSPEEVGGNALVQFGTELAFLYHLKEIGHVKFDLYFLPRVLKYLIRNVMYQKVIY
jgi:outer membrane protein insertion porin family